MEKKRFEAFSFIFGRETLEPILPHDLFTRHVKQVERVLVAEGNVSLVVKQQSNELDSLQNLAKTLFAFAQRLFGLTLLVISITVLATWPGRGENALMANHLSAIGS